MTFRKEQQSTHPPKLSVLQLAPSTSTYLLAMSPNGTFDSTGFTDFDNSDPVHDNSSTVNSPFDAFDREGDISPNLHSRQYASSSMQVNDWYLYPSNIGGPSTGAEGASDGPARTPTTLYPTNRVSFEESKSRIPPCKPSFRDSTARHRI